jgi:hypothetical protein
MSGMYDGDGEAGTTGLVQEIGFDGRLLDPILAERSARLLLGGRHLHARTVHPDGAAVHHVLHAAAQSLDELPDALGLEADHVDHHVRL